MARGPQRPVVFFCPAADERGRMAEEAFNAVAAKMGLPWRASCRDVAEVTGPEVEGARLAVALSEEHQPLIRERVGALADRVLSWQTPSGQEAKAFIERAVMALVARLLGGSEFVAPPPGDAPPRLEKPSAKPTVRVGRETKGRRGSGVTIVSDLPLNEEEIRQLATTLKQRCGTGGTVKDGRIEIQGDMRERVSGELERLGYRVKRAGG